MSECVFCKIRDREIAKEFIYEDRDVMVFSDINPVRPIHLLIIPKEHVKDFINLKDRNLISKLWQTVGRMIAETGLLDKGYRLVVNGGGAQEVFHLHIHLTGPLGKSVEM